MAAKTRKGKAKKAATPAATDQRQIIHRREEAAVQYQGPLPIPQHLQQYEQVLPGAAERILAMAESQKEHRQDLERLAVRTGARDSLLGLIFGFLIGVLGICGGVFLGYHGQMGGLWLSGGSLVSLVGVFVWGSRQRRREREQKSKALDQR